MFWNLLANAVKFTPRGGHVRVTLRPEPHDIVVTIADSGAGIDPEVLPFIFQRFRQGDARHGGLGLGLALVRHYVELHGGQVRAASEGPDRGATFTVTLPMAPAVG